ncbi:MAG: hypothetical protein EBR82_09355 [Caulobacteraceae bacterium]|nr:hypothetical protein [Caulobacteraceae bacterium]
MTVVKWALAPIFALGLAAQAVAQTPPPVTQTTPDTVDDVTVTGTDAEQVDAFVGELLEPARLGRNAGQLARWKDELCVRVIGGEPDINRRLGEQITDALNDLGARVKDGYCRRPNVMVVIADDAGGFARAVGERYRNRLFDNRREDIAEFSGPARPVRWQHRTQTTSTGNSAQAEAMAGGYGARGGELPNTRLGFSTAEAIDRALIVVDPRRLGEVPSRGLAAYVAFAVLLDMPQLPEVEGQDTILNLFEPGGPTALTAWDRALIQAVYAVRVGQPFSTQQEQIARGMRRSLVEVGTAPTP